MVETEFVTHRNVDLSKVEVWLGPQPGGQTEFLDTEAFEALGGGGAGGGKSWDLVVDALGVQFVSVNNGLAAYQAPGYRAVLFRRKSNQLSELLDEAKKIYPYFGGVYTAQRTGDPGPCFEFRTYEVNNPAKIYFCHMENEDDKEAHQGKQYQYIGFDELTHFTLTQYLYLYSRCRGITGIPRRIRSTCNPTGPGLWWVRKRFINCGLKPGEIGYFLMKGDPILNPAGILVPKGTRRALSRVFIPMYLRDNKILVEADPDYEDRIWAMGTQMKRALLDSDWNAFGGDFFAGFVNGPPFVIPPFLVPREWPLYLSIDPGFAGVCSAGLTAADFEGNYYRIATYYERGRSPAVNAKAISEFIQNCKWTVGRKPNRCIAGLDAWAKKDRYAVIENDHTFADAFQAEGIMLERATVDRKQGWWNWKSLFSPKPRWFVLECLNNPLLEEMISAVADEKDEEDIQGFGNDLEVKDHALDENRYILMAIAKPVEITEKRGWQWGNIPGVGRYQEKKGWRPGRG